jgi:hypothetical protein
VWFPLRSALVVATLLSVTSLASGHAAHLEWTAPDGCPQTDELHSAVERLLGEPLVQGAELEARGRVTHDDDARYTLVLTVQTPEGEGTRSVRADSCEGILDIAAFSIALAINPELSTATPPEESGPSAPPQPEPRSEPEPAPPTASDSAHEPTRVAAPEPEPAPPKAPELWFGAGGVVDSSLLPSPAAGFTGFADVRILGQLRFGLSGQIFLPQSHDISGGGGRFSMWLADAHACWQTAFGVALAACANFQVGAVHGTGHAVPEILSQDSRLWLPGASVLAFPSFSRSWSGVLGASARVPLQRDKFVVHAGQLHEIPGFSVEVWAGVMLRAL